MRPVPEPDELTRPFWDACRRHELVVQACRSCGTRFFTPLPVCPKCRGAEWSWEPSPGTGTLYSFTEVQRPPGPGVDVPYVLGIVDLDDGWTMLTNVVDYAAADLRCGRRVRVRFVDIGDGAVLPCFAPD